MDKSQHPTSVYHYTTIEAACSIIQSNTLHASSIDFLNDTRELTYFNEFVFEGMKDSFANCLKELGDKFKGEVHDIDSLAFREAMNYLNSMRRTTERLTPVFVVSFCRAKSEIEERDGLLSQWRGYGKTGAVALRFDVRGLDDLAQRESAAYAYAHFNFGDVVYGSADVEFKDISNEFEIFAKSVPKMIETILKSRNIEYKFKVESVELDHLYEPYLRLAPRLKDPGFAEESEWRFILSPNKEVDKFDGKLAKSIFHKPRNDYLMPYIVLNDGLKDRLPISGILVGPTGNVKRRVQSLESLLRNNGYNSVEVIESNIPFI